MLAPPHPTMDGWPDRKPNRPGFPPPCWNTAPPHGGRGAFAYRPQDPRQNYGWMDGWIVWIVLRYWLFNRLVNRDPEISWLMKIPEYNWVGFRPFYGFCCQYLASAWRNIPFSKWLISMVILNRLKIGLWDPFQMAQIVCKWRLVTIY